MACGQLTERPIIWIIDCHKKTVRNRRNKEVSVDGQALLSFYPYFKLLVLPHGFVVMGIGKSGAVSRRRQTEKWKNSDSFLRKRSISVKYHRPYERLWRSTWNGMGGKGRYVSCVIQINTDAKNWVSDSPYIHAFDDLERVHCQMEEEKLIEIMDDIH